MISYLNCHKLEWHIPHLHKTHCELGGNLMHLNQQKKRENGPKSIHVYKVHVRKTFGTIRIRARSMLLSYSSSLPDRSQKSNCNESLMSLTPKSTPMVGKYRDSNRFSEYCLMRVVFSMLPCWNWSFNKLDVDCLLVRMSQVSTIPICFKAISKRRFKHYFWKVEFVPASLVIPCNRTIFFMITNTW